MLTDKKQLPVFTALDRPKFEQYWSQFKTLFIDNLRAVDADAAAEAQKNMNNELGLFSRVGQAFIQFIITRIEADNEKARQMLPGTSVGNNLDRVAAFQGLVRQQLTPGDANAIPPVAPVMESDEALLQRFWLAPHAPAAGTGLHYKYAMLTLDERPVITLTKPAANQVVLTYTFNESSIAAQVKDGSGVYTSPGNVSLPVLAASGNGVADQALLDAVAAHFNRDDVGIVTDRRTVVSAQIVNYTVDVSVVIKDGPDANLVKADLEAKLRTYADSQHRLGGGVQRSYIDYLAHQSKAVMVSIAQPSGDINASEFQALYCTAINVTVAVESN